jgi:hypothetical protein
MNRNVCMRNRARRLRKPDNFTAICELSRQCRILNISQLYIPTWSVARYLYFFVYNAREVSDKELFAGTTQATSGTLTMQCVSDPNWQQRSGPFLAPRSGQWQLSPLLSLVLTCNCTQPVPEGERRRTRAAERLTLSELRLLSHCHIYCSSTSDTSSNNSSRYKSIRGSTSCINSSKSNNSSCGSTRSTNWSSGSNCKE